MRFLHVADLHLGKRVYEFDMGDDQRHILGEILRIAEERRCDGLLVAGDVFDKSAPSADAVTILDDFLTQAAARKLAVFVVSGNHDSPERMAFGSRLMDARGVHVAGLYEGALAKVVLHDEFGPVNVHLLPFVKPAVVRHACADEAVATYDDAVRKALAGFPVDPAERNLLVAHQFVTAGGTSPDRSDSELVVVGELDNVDGSLFDAFDYVALGHIHKPQAVGRETLRYAGSPLKYSFSEIRHPKSATLVELGRKGEIAVTPVPLAPLRDLREIRGGLDALLAAAVPSEDYIHVVLTDEDVPADAMARLRTRYPNVMHVDFDNARTQATAVPDAVPDFVAIDPLAAFFALFRIQTGREADDEERRLATAAWNATTEENR